MDQNDAIDEFRGDYRFLSNFYPCRVYFDGLWYRDVESAFQAAKTLEKAERRVICDCASPSDAKSAGNQLELRPDWEKVKLEIMADLLWQKFILNHELRERLLDTGERQLIEGNTWGDKYWGVCDGVGHNHLGRLLMALRAVAREVDSSVVTASGRFADKSA